MKKILQHSRKGFTLVELMIVLTIIGILMAVSIFPYGDYMNRVRLTNNVDAIAQEWILSHKQVRNGLEFDNDTHATIIWKFDEDANTIERFIYKTEQEEDVTTKKLYVKPLTAANFLDTTKIKPLNINSKIPLEKNITFRGKNINEDDEIFYYTIIPPYGEGIFYDKNFQKINEKEQKIFISLGKAPENSTMTKSILLRPYLQ